MDLIPRLRITINLFFPDGVHLNGAAKRDPIAYDKFVMLHKEIFNRVHCTRCGSGFQKMAKNLLKYYNDNKDEYIEE